MAGKGYTVLINNKQDVGTFVLRELASFGGKCNPSSYRDWDYTNWVSSKFPGTGGGTIGSALAQGFYCPGGQIVICTSRGTNLDGTGTTTKDNFDYDVSGTGAPGNRQTLSSSPGRLRSFTNTGSSLVFTTYDGWEWRRGGILVNDNNSTGFNNNVRLMVTAFAGANQSPLTGYFAPGSYGTTPVVVSPC